MRDRAGFEQGRRRDSEGRPLKLISQPPTAKYAEGWERVFGEKKKKQESMCRSCAKAKTCGSVRFDRIVTCFDYDAGVL